MIDHDVFAQKMKENDKRLHQVVEYVREKCDERHGPSLLDFQKVKLEIEDQLDRINPQLN